MGAREDVARSLVVDDDADVRHALVESLAHAGISAFHAFDGLEALERIRAGCRPCSIVLDVNMPRLDGVFRMRSHRTWGAATRLPRRRALSMGQVVCAPVDRAPAYGVRLSSPAATRSGVFRCSRVS
jgi:Response regulator receiver domain